MKKREGEIGGKRYLPNTRSKSVTIYKEYSKSAAIHKGQFPQEVNEHK